MIVKGLYRQTTDQNDARTQIGQVTATEKKVGCIATDRKLNLIAVAIGIAAAVALVAIELFVLYKEILDLISVVIVESLQLIVNLLRLLA